jgi:hypothetical protein
LNHLITAATTPSAKRTARGRRSREEQRRETEAKPTGKNRDAREQKASIDSED